MASRRPRREDGADGVHVPRLRDECVRPNDGRGLQALGGRRAVKQFLAAALEYREAGLHPIPLTPRSKRPALGSWKRFMHQMPTVGELESWWAANPDANVGIWTDR